MTTSDAVEQSGDTVTVHVTEDGKLYYAVSYTHLDVYKRQGRIQHGDCPLCKKVYKVLGNILIFNGNTVNIDA